MHSVSPYSIRCFNPQSPAKNHEDKYCVLNKIGQYDIFDLLEEFLNSYSSKFRVVEDSKQVFTFTNLEFDRKNREICGWFNVGVYGIKSDIIDISTGNVDFEKAVNNAEIIRHYFHIYIPLGFNEGICILHNYRGSGVKTLFHSLFSDVFRSKTRLNVQMNPLAYEKAMNAWNEARAKEIKVTKFSGLEDAADQLKKLGHQEQELIIRPPRRKYFGKLKDYFNKESELFSIVEALEEFGEDIKTVVELGGKRRTFSVGGGSNTVCRIEIDDDIVGSDGYPEFQDIKGWVRGVLKDYTELMYPGLEMIA